MVNEGRETLLSRGAQLAAALAIAVLFAAIRLLHLVWRPPFFDELFTAWVAALPPDHILEVLRSDSGPPLYYALVHLVSAGNASVAIARAVSLIAGAALLAAVLRSERLGGAALIAGLLLAVFAPHVYFSAEARAYALAGALAGGGCLALAAWAADEQRRALVAGTALLVAAASSHYYGVLFFAIPLALGLLERKRRMIVQGATASVLAGIVFIPGFLLAAKQPAESIAWMRLVGDAPAPLAPFAHLAFAAKYPPLFVAPPPIWLHLGALAVTVIVVALGFRSADARRWGVMTLVPVALVAVMGLAGKGVYFPFRFEAVIAGPFVCWLATSLRVVPKRSVRGVLLVLMIGIGVVSSYFSIMTALARRPDRWREAAVFVRRTVPETIPLVASGYSYLETVSQSGDEWRPKVTGFPDAVESHPGWVARATERDLAAAAETLPPVPFVWIGEQGSTELRVLRARYALRALYVARGMVVVEATGNRR